MKPKEFFDLVKAQREACKTFNRGRTAEEIKSARERYFSLSDQIDAEIARVDKLMNEQSAKQSHTDANVPQPSQSPTENDNPFS